MPYGVMHKCGTWVRVALVPLVPPFPLFVFGALALFVPTWTMLRGEALALFISAVTGASVLGFVLDRHRRYRGPRRGPKALWFCLLVLVLLAAAASLRDASRISVGGIHCFDQAMYVGVVTRAQELGWPGLRATLGTMVSGAYTADNQHPLYIWILAALLGDEVRSYYVAQLVTIAIGCLIPVVACMAVGRVYGLAAGVLAGLLLALNGTLIRHCCVLNAEGLLVLFSLLSWHLTTEAFRRMPQRVGACLFAAGICTGIAWLAKGSGAFFAFAFVAAGLAVWGRAMVRQRGVWLYLLGFVAVAWPLLVRNTRVYGSPLHNWNTPRLWLDGAQEADAWGRDTSGLGPLFYLERHGWRGACVRLRQGLVAQTQCLTHGLTVRLPKLKALSGTIVLAASLAGLLLDPNRGRRVFNLVVLALFFVFFAWYDLARGGRFTLPVLPVVYTGFSIAAHGSLRSIAPRRLRRHTTALSVLACLLLALAVGIQHCAPVGRGDRRTWPVTKPIRRLREAPCSPLHEHIEGVRRR